MTNGIGRDFMERTKYKYLGSSDQQKGLTQPPLEVPKSNKDNIVDLPDLKNFKINQMTVDRAISQRTSERNYSKEPLSLEELSYLLWCTQGVKSIHSRNATLRTVPSAGARHAFETYILVNLVEGIEPGLYRFLALSHQLQEVDLKKNIAEKITDSCLKQRFISLSAVTFIWVAVVYRMMWRYQERGYRYIHLDAGHICQNLYLAAESIDSGVCAIGAFDDDALNTILGIDGIEQFAVYVATCGKKNDR